MIKINLCHINSIIKCLCPKQVLAKAETMLKKIKIVNFTLILLSKDIKIAFQNGKSAK